MRPRLAAPLEIRKITPVELLEQALARLDAMEPKLNALIHVDREGARSAASEAMARQEAARAAKVHWMASRSRARIYLPRNSPP